jgi:spermidine synthase
MLALEVTLTRLLSVVSWYHLSFFAIAIALLGMTAGSTTIYLNARRYTDEKNDENVADACLRFALFVPVMLIATSILRLRLDFNSNIMDIITLGVLVGAMLIPFYYAGIAISLILTRSKLPIGKLYASDLIGAALGALFVLGALEIFDAPSLILLCSALAALAALIFAQGAVARNLRRRAGLVFAGLAVLGIANAQFGLGIRPVFVKGGVERVENIQTERWNSYSRIAVYKPTVGRPSLWGASAAMPEFSVEEYRMNIDGDAATFVHRFETLEDIEHLRYDVTNIAYYLRPTGGAFIIGVGGGRDLQSALLFGHEQVTGVDVNPVFIDLLQTEFRDFAGLAERDDVTLIVGEGRGYLSESQERYRLIQMSLIDTWAATGAGAFALSENALYTVEAWKVFYDHLTDDGIYTVSRWYNNRNLGETGRVVSLAMATLMQAGVENPSQHIAMVTTRNISTLLMSKSPLSTSDLDLLVATSDELEYDIAILPGVVPEDPVLRAIVENSTLDELYAAVADMPYNFTPTTDENPYFFNILRFDKLNSNILSFQDGVIRGNIVATLTLALLIMVLMIMVVATIIIPLSRRRQDETLRAHSLRDIWGGALYFSLIGAGFMFVEIGLIQRLSVFLSHPIYALGILLFTIILSTGIGSYLSDRLPLTRTPWVFIYPIATVVVILAVRFISSGLLAAMVDAPLLLKIVVSVLMIAPLGILMGFFFPTGMRLVRATNQVETPWYWALNGVFSVLSSASAVFVSIYISISMNFYIGAACYALLLVGLYRMVTSNRSSDVTSSDPILSLETAATDA